MALVGMTRPIDAVWSTRLFSSQDVKPTEVGRSTQ